MFSIVRKFILLLLIAGIPLQGAAMQFRMTAHQDMPDHVLSQQSDMGATHDCCPHDSSDQEQPAQALGGDCSHCPLCGVSLVPSMFLTLGVNAAATLHPTPTPYVTSFYPEQPQRPPLSRHA